MLRQAPRYRPDTPAYEPQSNPDHVQSLKERAPQRRLLLRLANGRDVLSCENTSHERQRVVERAAALFSSELRRCP